MWVDIRHLTRRKGRTGACIPLLDLSALLLLVLVWQVLYLANFTSVEVSFEKTFFSRVGWFVCQGWYYNSRSEFWIQVQSLLGQAFQKSGLGRPSTKQTQKSRHNQCFCQHSNPKATRSTFVKVKVHLLISKSQPSPWFYAHFAFCFSFLGPW